MNNLSISDEIEYTLLHISDLDHEIKMKELQLKITEAELGIAELKLESLYMIEEIV